MRWLVVVVMVGACPSAGPTRELCEDARDRALSHQREFVDEVLAETPATMRAIVEHQARDEDAALRSRFVEVCEHTSDFRTECFASSTAQRSPQCRSFMRTFLRAVVR